MIPLYGRLKGSKGIYLGMGLDEVIIDFENGTATTRKIVDSEWKTISEVKASPFVKGIIAIQGTNGVGKSTIMKLMLHPYLMSTGSKKKIQEHFQLRDSEKEFICLQDGIKYRSLILIDAKSEKAEAYLYKYLPDGKEEPLNNGLLGSYNEKVEEIFGSEEIFANILNSSRKLTPITQMLPSKRKEIFYYYLGSKLAIFEKLELIAKGRYDDAMGLLETARTRKSLIEEQFGKLPAEAEINSKLVDLEKFKTDCTTKADEFQKAIKRCDEQILQENHKLSLVDETEKKIIELQNNVDVYKTKLSTETANYTISNKQLQNKKLELEADIFRKERILLNEDKIKNAVTEIETIQNFLNVSIPLLKLEKSEIENKIAKINHDYQELKSKYDSQIIEIKNRYSQRELELKNEFKNKQLDYNLKLSETKRTKEGIENRYQTLIDEEEKNYRNATNEYSIRLGEINKLETERDSIKLELTNAELLYNQKRYAIDKDIERAKKEAEQIDRVPCTSYKECVDTCEFLHNARTNRDMIDTLMNDKLNLQSVYATEQNGLIEKQSIKLTEIQELKSKIQEPNRNEADESVIDLETRRNNELSEVLDPEQPDDKAHISALNVLSLKKDDELASIHEPLPSDTLAQELEISRLQEKINKEITDKARLNVLEKENWINIQKEFDQVKLILPERKSSLEGLKTQINEADEQHKKTTDEIKFNQSSLELQVDQLKKQADRSVITSSILSWENEKKKQTSELEDNAIRMISINDAINSLKTTIESIANLKRQIEILTGEITVIESKTQRLSFIREGLSKNGIPALIIHNVGLEVAEIANEYLRDGESGLRISFDTLKPNKSGEYRESFEIGILRGESKVDVQDISDGETVWIDESISKAMGEYLTDPARYSRHKYDSDFTDEKDGALSPENKHIFMKLLDESRRRSNRHYSFMVTHSPEIWKTITQRIHLSKEGTIRIMN